MVTSVTKKHITSIFKAGDEYFYLEKGDIIQKCWLPSANYMLSKPRRSKSTFSPLRI
jgi:hypothetical protein